MILITKYSVGSLTTFITLAAITVYLSTRPRKSAATWWLTGYFGVLACLLLAYFLRYSLLTGSAVYTTFMANVIVFGVGCFIAFSYHYYNDPRPIERRICTIAYFTVAAVVYASNAFRNLDSLLIFDAAAHYSHSSSRFSTLCRSSS